MKLFNNLENIENKKDKFQKEFITNLSKFDKIILWGLSESTVAAIEFLNKNGLKVESIYDNDISKNNTIFNGVSIVLPNDEVYNKNVALIITCSYFETIRLNLLKEDKNIDNRLFMFDGYFLDQKDISYYKDNQDKIENCFNNFNDEKSKKLYEQILEYRYIRDINLIKDYYDSRLNCYLDDVFLNDFKEGLYIDAGSYNADFVTTLGTKKNISNCEFYIFEPNKIFSNNIKLNLENKYNYKVFPIALCDKKGNMEFQQNNSSTSHLIDKKYNAYNDTLDKDIELVETNTLDNLVTKKVSGIKIDIEGSEQSMLLGCTNIIKKYRPVMLISVYHKWNDLWEIMNYMINLNLNYKFYLRHYSLSVAKTILYCIPE